jgi:signal transduction histidine kinase/DNA-binding LacI/PurR family transcriptional regulator
MTTSQKPDHEKHTRSSNGRPTIGLLTRINQHYSYQMWCGVAAAAKAHNINALCFAGHSVHTPVGFSAQANILYDLIDVGRFDGLIIWDLMCNMLGPDGTRQFYDRYRPLPIVSIGLPMVGLTSVQVDNYGGMRQAIEHLIKVHGRRRIAFVRGMPGRQTPDERYRAYVDVLAQHDLPFDPARVAIPRDAEELSQIGWGRVALCRLIDEQRAEFDALVTTSDRFAHELLPELQVRGIRVPDDIALVSFDDVKGSHCLTPPLTTVSVSMYEVGRQAAETLVSQLEGQKVRDQVQVPVRLVVRQSCGCLNLKVTQVVAGPVVRTRTTEPIKVILAGQRKSIVPEMIRAVETAVMGLDPNWAEQLFDGFLAALTAAGTKEATTPFLSALDEILRQVLVEEGDIGVWSQVVSTMRRQILPYFSVDQAETQSRDRAEDLWLQAQAMIGEVEQRVLANREQQAEQRRRVLRESGTALATSFDVDDLVDILAQELSRLGISRGYLSLYEEPQPYRYPQPVPEWSQLVLAYDEENPEGASRVELEPGGTRFQTRQLAPEGILPQQGQYDLVVHALYFRDRQIGFVLLDGDQQEGTIYDTLRAQIGSALQGALLVQARREAEERLKHYATELERSNRELEQFAYVASHDLQEPLRMVRSYVQLLERRYKGQLGEDADEFIGFAVDGADRMRVLINDLLAYSRVGTRGKHFMPADCASLLEKALANMQLIVEETEAEITHDELPTLLVDDVQMVQLFQNLIGNGIKFRRQGILPVVHVGAQQRGGEWLFSVRDNGIGIDSQYFDSIFEIFQRLHSREQYEGTGIGLAVCKRIVERHGGQIWVESDLGMGSTFYFTIPDRESSNP